MYEWTDTASRFTGSSFIAFSSHKRLLISDLVKNLKINFFELWSGSWYFRTSRCFQTHHHRSRYEIQRHYYQNSFQNEWSSEVKLKLINWWSSKLFPWITLSVRVNDRTFVASDRIFVTLPLPIPSSILFSEWARRTEPNRTLGEPEQRSGSFPGKH